MTGYSGVAIVVGRGLGMAAKEFVDFAFEVYNGLAIPPVGVGGRHYMEGGINKWGITGV